MSVYTCIVTYLYFQYMKVKFKFVTVKVFHTLIWVFFNVVIFYSLYAVLINKIDRWLWISLGLILLETIILSLFGKKCPITLVARKYSDSTKDNFDIFLPNWLAKYNKLIYTIIVFIVIAILTWRLTH